MNEDEIRQDEGSICELYLQRFDHVCSICGQSLVEEVYYKAGLRTLPLVPFVKERLLLLREEQKENRRSCGRSYNKEYLDYVCVNEIGDLINPHCVTSDFPKLLEKHNLKHIRFHDLRHSCASLLLDNGVAMLNGLGLASE